MTWVAAILVGLAVGPMLPNWAGVFAFALGVGVYAGAITARRGPEWEEKAREGTGKEKQWAKSFMEKERERYGSVPRFSRRQLFLFEFVWSASLFVGAAGISRLVFG